VGSLAEQGEEKYVRFIAGVVVGILLAGVVAFGYFLSGGAPVAVADKVMPFERFLAKGALRARIEKEMQKNVPVATDESTYVAGAKIYVGNCAVCRGFPNAEPWPIAKGMFPKPPRLFRGKGVTDDEPGETYWKVANGIRLSGMPAFKGSLSETELWQVTVLLANADKISDAVKDHLKPDFGGPPPAPSQPATPPKSKTH